MHWLKKVRWPLIVFTIFLTLAVLSSGQWLWQYYAIKQPLAKITQQIDGIEGLTWETTSQSDTKFKLNVMLTNPANLQTTYQLLTDSLDNILGHKKYKIIFHDHRTPQLEQFYYTVHYYIQEAIATGNFGIMAERIQEKSRENDVTAQVYVDAQTVYLELSDASGNMNIIIPRQSDMEVK
jgi:hypothetical protein